MSKITNDGLTRSVGYFIDYSYATCGRQTVKISTKVEYTSNCIKRRLNRGGNGALDRPRNAETAGTRVFFAPFVCFTNLLNMKFVIGAYKRSEVCRLKWYHHRQQSWYLRVVPRSSASPLLSSDALVTVSSAFTTLCSVLLENMLSRSPL